MIRAGPRPLVLLALIGWFTAVASALLDNVTTVIFLAPMVLAMARRLRLAPAVFLMPMRMAAHIGGTATLIGDPPYIMIGSGANRSFLDFVEDLTFPCILMMCWLECDSRRYYAEALNAPQAPVVEEESRIPPVTDPVPAQWVGVICLGMLAGFLTHHITGMPPAVPALVGAAAALGIQDVLYLRSARPTAHERRHGILQVTERDIDWPTLSFFAFLFIIVGAAVQTCWLNGCSGQLERPPPPSGALPPTHCSWRRSPSAG